MISFDHADGVGHIVVDRPERRNAINHAALDELGEALERARIAELRVLVISGAAGQFCSGADLKELEDLEFTKALRSTLDDLAGFAFPTIAAISGACMGLGLQLAMACDLRVATGEARFAIPVAKLGLMVDHWTVQRLALLAGHSTARQMLLTAEPITAGRAHQIGLVQELLEVDEGSSPGQVSLGRAGELASSISSLAPLALSGSKLGLDLLESRPDTADPDGIYGEAFNKAWSSDDLIEGRSAFKERRAPKFEGR